MPALVSYYCLLCFTVVMLLFQAILVVYFTSTRTSSSCPTFPQRCSSVAPMVPTFASRTTFPLTDCVCCISAWASVHLITASHRLGVGSLRKCVFYRLLLQQSLRYSTKPKKQQGGFYATQPPATTADRTTATPFADYHSELFSLGFWIPGGIWKHCDEMPNATINIQIQLLSLLRDQLRFAYWWKILLLQWYTYCERFCLVPIRYG